VAMNPPPQLLGPGGQPVQMPSNFECPTCKFRPKVAVQPGLPPGTPECVITAEPGDQQPVFCCIMCWNRFYAKFIRRHAPALVPVGDGVQYKAEEADPDEEVE
jgi:rubredoxin